MNNPPEHALPQEPEQSPTEHTTAEEPQQVPLHTEENIADIQPPIAEPAEQETASSIEPGDETAPVFSEPPMDAAERGPLVDAGTLASEPVEQEIPTETGDVESTEENINATDATDADGLPAGTTDADETLAGTDRPASTRSGIFVPRSWLIAVTSAIVLVVLLVVLLLLINRPQDPPTDWIGSYTPPAGSTSTGKILYYLHWTNQNGSLNGQLQLSANSGGKLQSLTVPATGLYNRDNHVIYVVVTISGQPDTLTGNINSTNDTLMLNEVGATSQDSQIVFHKGSASDYNQATKKLVPATKPATPTPAAK